MISMLDTDKGIFIYLHQVINSDSYSMIHNEGYLGEADSQALYISKWKAPKSTDFYGVYGGKLFRHLSHHLYFDT